MSPKPIREQIEEARQLDYVTIGQLSLLASISERTIWRLLKAGRFPHVLRHGRITRVHRATALRALRPENLAREA